MALNLKSLLTKILNEMVVKSNKNLLNGAAALKNGSGTYATSTFRNSGSGGTIAYHQAITPPTSEDLPSCGAIITATAANAQIGFCQDACPIEKQQITMSVWVKGNSGDKVVLQPIWSGTSGQEESGSQTTTLTDSNWHRLTYTKTPNYAHTSVSLGYVYYYAAATGNVLYIIGPKVEYSSYATPFWNGTQMSGSMKTSFNDSEIFGSKHATSTSLGDLVAELAGKYQMGSVYISTAYTTGGITLAAGWYNYISFYDRILLLGMTVAQRMYLVYGGSPIVVAEIQPSNMTTYGNMTNGTTTYYNLNGTAGTHYYYSKEGNKVTVNFNVKCTKASGSMTQFASGLPTHNHPTAISFPLACETVGTYKPMWVQINSNGTISGSLGVAGQYYYGSICYITNNG